MFLQRNVASQSFTIPGSLRLIADGSAVTTGASLSVQKDGTDAAAGGTLTHLRDGCYKYTPTQAETDCKILGYTLTATGAVGVCGSIRTTAADPNDAQRMGQTALPATGTLAVKPAVTLAASDVTGNIAADVQTIKTQAVAADNPVTFPGTISSYAGADTAGTSLLLIRLSDTRANFLDNLNIGGAVASHADVAAINTSSSKHLTLTTVGQYERPESGSVTYTVECRTFAASDGTAVNADTTPALSATGITSGNLSSNLSAATNPATGVYRWTYTVASAATLEQVRFDVSATIAGATFTLSAYTQVADFVAATWTTADRTTLNNLSTRALLALPGAAPGGDNGLFILGSNSTSAGVTLSAANQPALTISANGSYDAVHLVGGDFGAGLLLRGQRGMVINGTSSQAIQILSDQTGAVALSSAAGSPDIYLSNPPLSTSLRDAILSAGAITAASIADAALNGKGDWSKVAPDNASITAIKAKTDALPASPAATSDIPSATTIADTTLKRTTPNVEASSTGDAIVDDRSLYGLIQQAKKSNTTAHAGKLTVFKTDGTSELAQHPLSNDPTAAPTTGIS